VPPLRLAILQRYVTRQRQTSHRLSTRIASTGFLLPLEATRNGTLESAGRGEVRRTHFRAMANDCGHDVSDAVLSNLFHRTGPYVADHVADAP
jgi:hypothetical protein